MSVSNDPLVTGKSTQYDRIRRVPASTWAVVRSSGIRRTAARIALGLIAISALTWAVDRIQRRYEHEMERAVIDPPDAGQKAEFTFARLRYPSLPWFRARGSWESWGTDANKSERQFILGLRRLSRINTRSVEQVVDIDSDEIYDWPFLYAVEVGHWMLNAAQAKRLREYLDRGGFLMVDDFHGTMEWQVFEAGMKRVFPDRPIVELENADPIFHVIYDLGERFQVPGLQFLYSGRVAEYDGVEARWRAIQDPKGRIQVAICHNMDLGDAWEWADLPQYPERYASMAYRIGLNYLTYSMTH